MLLLRRHLCFELFLIMTIGLQGVVGCYGMKKAKQEHEQIINLHKQEIIYINNQHKNVVEQIKNQYNNELGEMQEQNEELQKQNKELQGNLNSLQNNANILQSKQKSIKGEHMTSLGSFRISFYDTSHNSQEGWGYQTASGVSLKGKNIHDRLVAIPPHIPLGSKLYIEFEDCPELTGIYTGVDRGGAIKGNKIDVFYEDYNMEGTVWDMGIKYAHVYLIGEE